MRIGPKRRPFDQQLSLSDWTGETGSGIIGYHSYEELPDEMVAFVHTQYDRFGIKKLEPNMMDTVIRCGAWATFFVIDSFDPYVMLARGISDVSWSDIGHTHTLEIKDPYNDKQMEADPERLEVFVPAPGQSERFFEYGLAHPGLQALPFDLGEMIQMHLFEWGGPEDWCNSEIISALQDLCTENGELNVTMYRAYWELAAWASMLWFAGPPGREWRVASHDVFWLTSTEGLAVLYDLSFLSKEYYQVHQRAPQSCCVCGLDSYCVDLVHLDGMTRFVCEKHLNGDLPLYPGATCGTKVCKFAVCPHHPMHGHEDAVYQMLKGGGQIHQINHRKQDTPAIAAGAPQKLIANK